MPVLCGMITMQHSTRKWSAICAQAVYFLHSTMLSVTCMQLNDVSIMCRVTYFQFPIQSAFLPCWPVTQHSRNIGHRVDSLYAAYSPGEWFWIDFSGKNGN